MQFRQLSVVEVTSSPGFQYDVFIAHSSQDAQVVRQLRDHLSDIGFTTWAYDDVLPGEPVHLSICAAMCRSRRCLLLVTPSYINSIFFQDELNNALDRQCRLGLVFCLPVYHQLDPDSRPYQLRDMHGLDYHSEDFWQKLKSAVKSEAYLSVHKNMFTLEFCTCISFNCSDHRICFRCTETLLVGHHKGSQTVKYLSKVFLEIFDGKCCKIDGVKI